MTEKKVRRPRRRYDEELQQDARIARGMMSLAIVLEERYPDLGEFVVVRKMLDDGIKALVDRANQVGQERLEQAAAALAANAVKAVAKEMERTAPPQQGLKQPLDSESGKEDRTLVDVAEGL